MEHILLVAAKVLVLALGMAISVLSFLAYRRTRARLMLFLSVGFALVATGSFLEGLLYDFLAWDLVTAHIVESVFLLVGFGSLAILLRPRKVRA